MTSRVVMRSMTYVTQHRVNGVEWHPGEMSNDRSHLRSALMAGEDVIGFSTLPERNSMRTWMLTIASSFGMYLCPLVGTYGDEPSDPAPSDVPADAQQQTGVLIAHDLRSIEGWTVHVDRSLLGDDAGPLGPLVLRVLTDQLFVISLRLPENRLESLRAVPIWLDRAHPLTSLQYHPSAEWLREHGYDPAMARSVHIPRAQRLVDHIQRQDQPWCVLHELAHAYHDRVLGGEHVGIRKSWQSLVESGRGESVLHLSGQPRRHYALTNHKEFFAEMSESFLGTNDFYPFVRGELREFDPEIYALMQSVWMEPRPVASVAD